MDRNLYKFGFDWLNGVLPVTDVWEVFQQLEKFSSKLAFDRWQRVDTGRYNYGCRYFLDGKPFIQLMYNPVSSEEQFTACVPEPKSDDELEQIPIDLKTHNNPYIFFTISGDGVRYLHSIGGEQTALNKLMFYFYRNGFRCTRLDPYCDILDKDNKVVDLIVDNVCSWDKREIGGTSISTNMRRINANFRQFPNVALDGSHYTNVQIGNHSSNMGMFRCYNKLDEIYQGRLGGKITKTDEKNYKESHKQLMQDILDKMLLDYGVEDYLYRLEYELHGDYAAQNFNALMSSAEKENKLCLEDVFYAALSRFFGIVTTTTLDGRIRDFSFCFIWQEFLDFVGESIHLVEFAAMPYISMRKARLHSYIKKNSVFVFSILVALFMDRALLLSILPDGAQKYFGKKKYNDLRDELKVPIGISSFVKTQFERGYRTYDKWFKVA